MTTYESIMLSVCFGAVVGSFIGNLICLIKYSIHSLSSDGELMLTLLASFAQEESLSVSENMKWRIRKNFEEGMPWNATMLGYRMKDGHLCMR